ncbi:MAG: hypothetical protein GY715_08355 [Planctomycetes bacterium]|nr:hypothetical protein [Planctomycetota bacterium]
MMMIPPVPRPSHAAPSHVDSGMSLESSQGTRLVSELEDRLDRLAMLCCAMWTMIQAHSGATDEELMHLVRDLDLADGRVDGKAGQVQVTTCTACQRPVALKHLRCLYCGQTRVPAHPFEGVL